MFASRLTLLAAPDGAVVDVAALVVGAAVLAELGVGDSVALLDDEELELPQPVSATSAATSASDEIEKTARLVACPVALYLTNPP